MNINDLGTQLLYTTVPILIQDAKGISSSGTGFIFSVIRKEENVTIPMLITNHHVLAEAKYGFFELHLSNNNLPINKTIRISFDEEIIGNNKLGDLDLIAIPLASTLNNLSNKTYVFFRAVDQSLIPDNQQFSSLSAVENICFIGYPNGIYDAENKLPIIRQGITATPIWNHFNGKKQFLIDGGVYPGSSGSPVFIFNQGIYTSNTNVIAGSRLLFVGIVSGTYRSNDPSFSSYLNLGIVISSVAFLEELNKLIARLEGK